MFGLFKKKHGVEISPSIIFQTIAILGGLYFFYQIRSIIILLFLSLIIMVALHPAVKKLQKKKIPRSASIAIVYVSFIVFIITIAALIIPPLASELIKLLKIINVPYLQDLIHDFELSLSDLGSLIGQFNNSVSFIVSAISSTFSGVFTIFTLILMSVYLMIDRPNFHKKIAWFTRKPKHFITAKRFIDSLEEQLGGWVRGQTILMITIAIANYIGLSLLKIPFALPLSILGGLLNVLPNLGPLISAVPAVIIALITFGPNMAGIVILLYIVIQQLESNILVPKIMETNANVNPLIAIISVLSGFEIAGIMGALLAIPLYIVARAFYSAWRNHQF